MRRELIAVNENGMWTKYPSCPYCGFTSPDVEKIFEVHMNLQHRMFKQEWKVRKIEDRIMGITVYLATEDQT